MAKPPQRGTVAWVVWIEAELERLREWLAALGHDELCPRIRGEKDTCTCTEDD